MRHDRDFGAFEARLLEGGVTASRARRIGEELAEHYRDLCDEARQHGLAGDEIADYAGRRLGNEADLAAAALARPELKCWIYRYPHVARIALPVAYVSLLPAVPLVAGVQHAPVIARWGACLMLSALLTGALMLSLYLTILAPIL